MVVIALGVIARGKVGRLEALLEALGGGEVITADGGAGDVLKAAAGWRRDMWTSAALM